MPKVLIADDHPLYRSALKTVLDLVSPQFQVAEAEALTGAVEMLRSDREIELLLLDLNMPGSRGFTGLLEIRREFPQLPVIVVSGDDKVSTIEQVKKLGAAGFLSKTATPVTIGDCISAIEMGDEWFPESDIPAADDSLVDRMNSLTPQQYRISQMIADGQLNKQIAYELGITEPTVKSHVTSILRKLQLRDRKQLIKAFSSQLVT